MKKLYVLTQSILLISIVFIFKINFYVSAILFFLFLASLFFLPYGVEVKNRELAIKRLLRKKRLNVMSMFPVDVRGVLRARLLGISAGSINFGLFMTTYGRAWLYTTDFDAVLVETDGGIFIVDRGMVDDGSNLQEGNMEP